MKKIKLIARENIYKNANHELLDDRGLKALDGYAESRICEVDDDYDM